MSIIKAVTLLDVTAVTSTQTGTAVVVGELHNAVICELGPVTAGVTGTLDVVVQHAPTLTGEFTTLTTFDQVTASTTTSTRAQSSNAVAVPMGCYRAVGTIGSGTYTFAVKIYPARDVH